MRTSPTSPILAEICDLDEVFTRDVRDIPMQTPFVTFRCRRRDEHRPRSASIEVDG
jgi:hypothetical protein